MSSGQNKSGHRPTKDWLDVRQAVLEEADEVITVADNIRPAPIWSEAA